MGTTFYLGRRVLTTDSDMGTIPANGQRFYTPDPLTQTIIAYRMGILAGRDGSSVAPKTRLGIALAASGGTPNDLIAYTSEITPNNVMTSGGNGTVYEANLTSPILLPPATYSLGATARSAVLNHAMRQAANITGTNRNFYTKSGLGSSIPTDPVGGAQSYEGHMDVWVTGVTNTKPSVPIDRVPYLSVPQGELTPTFEATFNDAEKVLPNGQAWDRVTQVQITVARSSDSVTFWNHTYAATSSEQADHKSSIVYAGTALVPGVEYKWQIRHMDRAGAWSDWSTWIPFTISAGGSVAKPTAPTGKQNVLNPGPFVAKWSHAGGLSTNLVEIQLFYNGTILQTSQVAKSVANNGNISLTWAETAFGLLARGGSYAFAMRARDTSGAWTEYGPQQTFTTNAQPATPSNISPTSGTVMSSRPVLSCKTSDTDNSEGSLSVTFHITRPDASTTTVAGVWNASTKTYRFQTTSTQLPTFGVYQVKAMASDGVFSSPYSGAVSFTYASGPTVTITSPTDGAVLTSSSFTVNWTTTAQASRQVIVFNPDGSQPYATPNEVTSSTSHTIPKGKLRDGIAYRVMVFVTNTSALTGQSQVHDFTIDLPNPSAIAAFQAYPIQVGTDVSPTAVQLEWSQTDFPSSKFEGYYVRRRVLGGAYAYLDIAEGLEDVLLRIIPSARQNYFTDYHPRAGVDYEYSVTQMIKVDLDSLESTAVTAQASVDIESIQVASALDPSVYRFDLRFLADSGPEHKFKMEQRQVVPMGARRGRTIRSGFKQWEPSGTFHIVSDDYATAEERMAAIRDAVENGKTFSYRDFRGRKCWVTIVGYTERDLGHYYEVSLDFREEEFTEGEAA